MVLELRVEVLASSEGKEEKESLVGKRGSGSAIVFVVVDSCYAVRVSMTWSRKREGAWVLQEE